MIIYKKDLRSGTFNKEDLHIKSMRPKKDETILLSNLEGLMMRVEVIEYDYRTGLGNYKIIEEVVNIKPKERVLIQCQIDKVYLDKLCELLPIVNITELVIVTSELSQMQTINLERLNNICIRSCEQSHNPYLPRISVVKIPMIEYLKTLTIKPLILELPEKNNQRKNLIASDCILVGPEGGFSLSEIKFLKVNNYEQTSISKQVLPAWLAGYSYYSMMELL